MYGSVAPPQLQLMQPMQLYQLPPAQALSAAPAPMQAIGGVRHNLCCKPCMRLSPGR